MLERFERKSHPGWWWFIALSSTTVFLIDTQTPIGVATWLFHLVPVSATYFLWQPVAPLAVALVSTVLITLDYFISAAGVPTSIALLNRGMGLVVIWTVAILIRSIIFSRLSLELRDWIRAAHTQLSQRVIGDHSLREVSQRILDFLATYVGARVGALYVADGSQHVVRTAGYALPTSSDEPLRVAAREGLIGQCMVAQQTLRITDLPPDYLQITSGLGSHASQTLLVAPLIADDELMGVVELGFLGTSFEADRELLDALQRALGMSIRTAKLRSEREELLRATQRQAEELQTQQEELRVANEELEQHTTLLRDNQARLQTQQAELEQTNVQLEEHTQLLARQNDDLIQARNELTLKANELERANQFKSEFLANMSHELRTPLNSTLILAKLLSDNPTGNLTEEQVRFARSIYSAGNDLLELINDILDLSKIEARKIEVSCETIHLPHLVNSLSQTFAPQADQKSLALKVATAAALPDFIYTDSQRLRQILKNLLSNAIKFTPHGSVQLRVFVPEQAPQWIGFAVADTGIGIALEQQTLIFEPFRQADGTTNRSFGGTGLGLSISRELAALLGGRIELQSELGTGSTFTLLIPQHLPDVEREPEAPPPASRRELPSTKKPTPQRPLAETRTDATKAHGRLLLIIEDDVQFAATLCDLARHLDYECITAQTADEGIELALRHRPTAIVLDMRLPDHTGLTVLDRLKHNPATRHIPVQVISGYDYAQTALEMGAANVLRKPVEREQLIAALASLERKADHIERAVLIVEDNAVQRDSICRLLEAEGVRTVAMASGTAALAELRTQTFDCMVLDLALPDASGYELLKTMAQDERYSFPPVIVYTARTLSADEEQELRRYSKSIIIKGARSPERLIDEVTLFLHRVESTLSPEQRHMLRIARSRETVFQDRRILLVEDDVRNVFAITRLLEPQGAKLLIARNGKEALQHLERDPEIDLVLMDIMMPEMDGLEATQEIRRRAQFASLPIIALTAKAMPDDRQRCIDAGANDYITKPIDVEKLLSLVRIWLPRKKGLTH